MKSFVFAKIYLSKHMSWLSGPGYISGRLVQSDLFRLSCSNLSRLSCQDDQPGWPPRLSCPECPVPAFLFKWFCPRCPKYMPTVLPRLFSPGCSVLAVLSLLLFSASVSYPGCTIPSVFSGFSSPNSTVPAFLSWLFCPDPGCAVPAVLSTVLLMPLSCSGSPVLPVLSRLTHPGRLVRLTCSDWPVLAVLSEWPCPRCPTPVILPRLSRPLVLF
jgi:hypothetical protein